MRLLGGQADGLEPAGHDLLAKHRIDLLVRGGRARGFDGFARGGKARGRTEDDGGNGSKMRNLHNNNASGQSVGTIQPDAYVRQENFMPPPAGSGPVDN